MLILEVDSISVVSDDGDVAKWESLELADHITVDPEDAVGAKCTSDVWSKLYSTVIGVEEVEGVHCDCIWCFIASP